MKVSTTGKTPSINELVAILKTEFSDDYQYKIWGFRNKKRLIIRKSAFVGAEISEKEGRLTIDGAHPTIFSKLLSWFLGIFTGSGEPFFIATQHFFGSKYKHFEYEVGSFLRGRLRQV